MNIVNTKNLKTIEECALELCYPKSLLEHLVAECLIPVEIKPTFGKHLFDKDKVDYYVKRYLEKYDVTFNWK